MKNVRAFFVRNSAKISWLLAFTTIITVILGYLLNRWETHPFSTAPHLFVKNIFIALFTIHIITMVGFLKYNWKNNLNRLKEKSLKTPSLIKLVQRITGVLILIVGIGFMMAGLSFYFNLDFPFSLTEHVKIDLIFQLIFIVHMFAATISFSMRKGLNFEKASGAASILVLLLVSIPIAFESGYITKVTDEPGDRVEIEDNFYPVVDENIKQHRPEIFQDGYYSIFDVLVATSEEYNLGLQYHFDEKSDTYVIDSLNGKESWWYEVYYDGGFSDNPGGELNMMRIGHYPWKEQTLIRMKNVKEQTNKLNEIYETFREEAQRLENNKGKIVIPKVIIKGRTFEKEFDNVEITAHNLREDVFDTGIITAIDTILSLGDENKIEYDLKWFESIGTAEVVKSYWVNSIDADENFGRCGFVYELGEYKNQHFNGNNIHLPMDTRIIATPEYQLFYWFCY